MASQSLDYLRKTCVAQAVQKGLREMAAARPADPFEFLACFLEQQSGRSVPQSADAFASQPATQAPEQTSWSQAAERAVALSYLCSLYEHTIHPMEVAWGRRFTTGEVVEHMVVPATTSDRCRFADLPTPEGPGSENLWDPLSDAPMYFVSHAFSNPFALVVEALSAHFAAAGAVPSEVFVWLDVLAINQHDTNAELRGGLTLQRTIDLSVSTLVVLDREKRLPLQRLWCLFEIGSTPSEKLHLLTLGFEQKDVAIAFQGIDVESADCFDPAAKALIRSEIARRFGGIPEFTDFLRLRFLLRPLIFDEDVATLLARSGAEEWAFDGLREWVQPEPGTAATNAQSLIACVSADPGAGKSTVSAALVAGLGQVPHGCPQPLVHAHHFCARGDARRSDVVAIVKTLAYQLAMVYPEIKSAVLRLDPAAVAGLQLAEEALKMLLLNPIAALPPGSGRVVILIDGLDEGGEPLEPSDTTSMDTGGDSGAAEDAAGRGGAGAGGEGTRARRTLSGAAGSAAESLPPIYSNPVLAMLSLLKGGASARGWGGGESASALDKGAPEGTRESDAAADDDAVRESSTGGGEEIAVTTTQGEAPDVTAKSTTARAFARAPSKYSDARGGGFRAPAEADAEAAPEPESAAAAHDWAAGAGRLSVIVTCRSQPPVLVDAISGWWGPLSRRFSPGDFRPTVGSAAANATGFLRVPVPPSDPPPSTSAPAPRSRPSSGTQPRSGSRKRLADSAPSSMVLQMVFSEFRARHPSAAASAATPRTLQEAYLRWFETEWPDTDTGDPEAETGVRRLLALLVTAREPPTVAQLAALGARDALSRLPGHSVLFHARNFRVHFIHSSLGEFLTSPATPARFRADPAAGHAAWAELLVPRGAPSPLGGRRKEAASAALDDYAVRYTLHHVGEGWAGDATRADALRAAFLDFDFWQTVFARGHDQAMLDVVASLLRRSSRPSNADASGAGATAPVRVSADPSVCRDQARIAADVMRWLLQMGHFMRDRPELVLQCAAAAPRTSVVGAAARLFPRVPPVTLLNVPRVWGAEVFTLNCGSTARGACFGQFGTALVAVGHTGLVVETLTAKVLARLRHGSSVNACAWATAGGLIATAGGLHVKLWDARSTLEVASCEGHSKEVTACTMTSDAALIVSGSKDCTVRVWGGVRRPGKPLGSLEGHLGKVTRVAICADGIHAASSSEDSTVRVWDTASLTCVRVLEGHDGPALSVAVAGWGAKGPRIVASGGADKSIRIWDIQKDIRGRTGVGGNDAGNGCDDSEASVEHAPPKGDCDAGDGEEQRPTDTGAEDEAEQWDAAGELDGCGGEDAEGSPGRRANANADGGGGSADGNKQKRKGRKEKRGGKARGSGGAEGTAARERRTALREESLLKHVEDWAGMIGAQPRTLKAHSKGVVALTFSSDGLLLLSGGEEATLKLWRLVSLLPVCMLKGHSNAVSSAEISADRTRVISSSWDRTVKLWQLPTDWAPAPPSTPGAAEADAEAAGAAAAAEATEAADPAPKAAAGQEVAPAAAPQGSHGSSVETACVTPDGRMAFTGSADSTLHQWDATSGAMLGRLQGHGGRVLSCCVASNGRRAASASKDKTVRLWRIAADPPEDPQGEAGDPAAATAAAAELPAGMEKLPASKGAEARRQWEERRAERKLKQEEQRRAQGIPEGPFRPQPVRKMSGHTDQVVMVAFSPDGSVLASASADGTVGLWDGITGVQVAFLRGHEGPVAVVAFTPDSAAVLSAGQDGTVRRWDALTGAAVWATASSASGHQSPNLGLSASPDGRLVSSSDSNGVLALWRASDGALVRHVGAMVGRNGVHQGHIWHCPFSPDGALIAAAGSDTDVLLFSVADLESASRPEPAGAPSSASADQQAAQPQPAVVLRGHRRFVSAVKWLSARFVATASKDGTARVWDARSGACSHTFFASTAITCLAAVVRAVPSQLPALVKAGEPPPSILSDENVAGRDNSVGGDADSAAAAGELLGAVTLVVGVASGGVFFLECHEGGAHEGGGGATAGAISVST